MTTIAFDGKTLAADTLHSIDTTIVNRSASKITILGPVAIAVAGNGHTAAAIENWFLEKPDLFDGDRVVGVIPEEVASDESFSEVIIVDFSVKGEPPKAYWATSKGRQFVEVEAPFALGCGSGVALGAMLAAPRGLGDDDPRDPTALGVSVAEYGVMTASKVDVYTGGKVEVVRMEGGVLVKS